MGGMKKDYRKWHQRKSEVNDIITRPFFHEREIWFCTLGVNVGFEQDGAGKDFLRPVVIVRKFNNEIFWAIPLTKLKKRISKNAEYYYFRFSFKARAISAAILSQIRLVDARRLYYLVGEMSVTDFTEMKKRLKALLP